MMGVMTLATVVGSGIADQRLLPRDTGPQLLESSPTTGAVLMAPILALRPLDDPAGPALDAGRPIRDEIRRRVETLVAELRR
jgi:hypothetical protein